MTRLLGNLLLWTASRLGLLGFRMSDVDCTDCCCYLQLSLTPEKQMEAYTRAVQDTMAAVAEIEGTQQADPFLDLGVNAVAGKELN